MTKSRNRNARSPIATSIPSSNSLTTSALTFLDQAGFGALPAVGREMWFRIWLWVTLITVADRIVWVSTDMSWTYFTKVKEAPVYKDHEFIEMDVWSTRFFCPEGHHIAEITYLFGPPDYSKLPKQGGPPEQQQNVPPNGKGPPPGNGQGPPPGNGQGPPQHDPRARAPRDTRHQELHADMKHPGHPPDTRGQGPPPNMMFQGPPPHGGRRPPPENGGRWPEGEAPPRERQGPPLGENGRPDWALLLQRAEKAGDTKAMEYFKARLEQEMLERYDREPTGDGGRRHPEHEHEHGPNHDHQHKEMPNNGETAESDIPDSTNSYTITLYDAFFTWFKNKRKSQTKDFAKDAFNLDIKFSMTESVETTLLESLGAGIYLTNRSFPITYGPCAPLAYCIGHPACLFRYSNEFCLEDPLPGKRKALKMRMQCQPDDTFYGNFQIFQEGMEAAIDSMKSRKYVKSTFTLDWPTSAETTMVQKAIPYAKYAPTGALVYSTGDVRTIKQWPQNVVFVKYQSQMEHGVRDYANTTLQPLMINKTEVFNLACPNQRDARRHGYWGDCDASAPHPYVVAEFLWKNMGRTPDPVCRDELLQVYCAYAYNPYGLCVPPFMVHEDTWTNRLTLPKYAWNTLPENGQRYDLTTYNSIFLNEHRSLIPVRIGFLIVAHSAPNILTDVLKLLYREQHYYVIHIDKRKDEVREALIALVAETFPGKTNIRVIPKERSFAPTWGSYQIQRVELQGFEELIQMGVWDFSFIISGTDLPLRNIDDMAAMLGPYRGFNFLNVLRKSSSWRAWHTCDDHVFGVGLRDPQLFDIYSHSAWVLLSREFTETVVSAKRPLPMIKAQFFLQTTFIPDETYLGTLLAETPELRPTMIERGFHHMKPFFGKDPDNLCRHSDVTDACGQGPTNYEEDDFEWILGNSHSFFFARKFAANESNEIRVHVSDYVENDLYARMMLEETFSDNIIGAIAVLALDGTHWGNTRLKRIVDVNDWKIVPSLRGEIACCASNANAMYQNQPFRIFMDFVGEDENLVQHNARASFLARNQVSCFPTGSVRAMFVSTRYTTNPFSKRGSPERDGSPIPTQPISDHITLHMAIDIGEQSKECKAYAASKVRPKRQYTELTPESIQTPTEYKFDAIFKDASNHIICAEDVVMHTAPDMIRPGSNTTIFSVRVNCTKLSGGWHSITVKEKDKEDPFEYSVSVFFADESSIEQYEAAVMTELQNLWTFEELAIITPDFEDIYYVNKPIFDKQFSDDVGQQPAGDFHDIHIKPDMRDNINMQNKPDVGDKVNMQLKPDKRDIVNMQNKPDLREYLNALGRDTNASPAENGDGSELRMRNLGDTKTQAGFVEAGELPEVRIPWVHNGDIPVNIVADAMTPQEGDGIGILYFVVFSIIVVGSLFLYTMCLTKAKNVSSTFYVLSRRPVLAFMFIGVVVIQMTFYQLSKPSNLYPHQAPS